MTPLRISMLRAHATSSWALLLIVVAATSLFATANNVLVGAAISTPDSMAMTATVAGWTLTVTVFSAVFLVAQAMAFALDARRRELALLRLAGATPRQVGRQVMTEAVVFGFAGSLIGFFLGWPAGQLLRAWLVSVDFADPALDPTPEPWSLAVVLGIGILTCALGAAAAARRSGRVEPIEALGMERGASRVMTAPRWIFAVLAISGAIAILTARATPEDSLGLLHFADFLLVAGLAALAPVIVPTVARTIGVLLALLSPGSGFLAAAHTRYAVRRTAALAVPMLILVGTSTSFLFLFATKTPMAAADREHPVGDVVATESMLSMDETLDAVAGIPELGPMVAVQTGVWWTLFDEDDEDDEDDEGVEDLEDLEDLDAIALGGDPVGAGALHVLDGSWDDVGDDVVAVTGVNSHVLGDPGIGDLVSLEPGNGEPQDFTVGAIVEVSSAVGHPGVVFTPEQFAAAGIMRVDAVHALMSPETSIDAASEALASALPDSRVEEADEMADRVVAEGQVAGDNALYSILAAGVLLSLLTIVTTQVSSVRERSREFALLRRTGASPRQIAAAVLGETVLIVTVVAVAVATNVAFIATRTGTILNEMGYSFATPIPSARIGILFATGVVVAVVAALTTLTAARPRT